METAKAKAEAKLLINRKNCCERELNSTSAPTLAREASRDNKTHFV